MKTLQKLSISLISILVINIPIYAQMFEIDFDKLKIGNQYKVLIKNGWETEGKLIQKDSNSIDIRTEYKIFVIPKSEIKDIVDASSEFRHIHEPDKEVQPDVYSQNDSTWTIRTKPGFSIDYIAGFKNVYPYYAEISDIKKLSYITDSTVKVTAKDSYKEININKINEIRFKGANKMGLGIGIGAGLGFLAGAIYGVVFVNSPSINEGTPPSTGETMRVAISSGIIFAIPGAILGGIIGVLIPSEKDSLTLSTVKGDKKDKLMKFLKRNNKTIKNY